MSQSGPRWAPLVKRHRLEGTVCQCGAEPPPPAGTKGSIPGYIAEWHRQHRREIVEAPPSVSGASTT